jgi:hypothetical protein
VTVKGLKSIGKGTALVMLLAAVHVIGYVDGRRDQRAADFASIIAAIRTLDPAVPE